MSKVLDIAFWDPYANNGMGAEVRRVMTLADFNKINWETITVDEFRNMLPAGCSYESILNLLIDQLSKKSKKIRELEDDLADTIVLGIGEP